MFKDQRFKNLTLENIQQDLIAGLTVGVVAIPLGMAFSIASGVKPEYGLYTTIIAGLLVALFGGSKFQIAGPTGAFIPILLAIVLQYGYEDLLIAGLLAGIMLILMGIFKVGNLIKFIPRSVTIGFTSGIAVIIFSGQIADFLGLENIEKKEFFHQNMLQILKQINTFNIYSILIAIIGVLLIIFIPRWFPRIPVLLIALLIPTLISVLFFPGKVATIGSSFGGISAQLPAFSFPKITWEKILTLWQPAFVIAMLGGIESLLSAVVSDGMTNTKHNSNRELFGQGIANVITPLFGGIPATGAIARTATNINSGAVSPLSGVFQSLFVLLTLLIFAPFASHIPLASMAPILMVVAINMSSYRSFLDIVKFRSSDTLVLLTTFSLTVLVNLTVAVQFGLLLAMITFIRRMYKFFNIKEKLPQLVDSGANEDFKEDQSKDLMIFTIAGPLFFGAAKKFEETVFHAIRVQPKAIILDLKNVPFIDATGEDILTNLIKDLKKQEVVVYITNLSKEPLALLKKGDFFQFIEEDDIFPSKEAAIKHHQSTKKISTY